MSHVLDEAAGLPANIAAETTILGAILLDNSAYLEVAEKLVASDFVPDFPRRIFMRMSALLNNQRTVDMVTLAEELILTKELEMVGGRADPSSLTEGLPWEPAITEYIEIVIEKSSLRRVMEMCERTTARAADQGEAASTILSDAEQTLSAVSDRGVSHPLESFAAWLPRQYQSVENFFSTNAKAQGIATGITGLDEMTCGFQNGDLVVIAARPSMGKTAAGLGFALNASVRDRKTVAFFSLEMTKESILQRSVANIGCIPLKAIRECNWTDVARRYAMEAMTSVTQAPFYIDDHHQVLRIAQRPCPGPGSQAPARQLDLVQGERSPQFPCLRPLQL